MNSLDCKTILVFRKKKILPHSTGASPNPCEARTKGSRVCPATAQQGPAWRAAASLEEGAGGPRAAGVFPARPHRYRAAGRGGGDPGSDPSPLTARQAASACVSHALVSTFGWSWILCYQHVSSEQTRSLTPQSVGRVSAKSHAGRDGTALPSECHPSPLSPVDASKKGKGKTLVLDNRSSQRDGERILTGCCRAVQAGTVPRPEAVAFWCAVITTCF